MDSIIDLLDCKWLRNSKDSLTISQLALKMHILSGKVSLVVAGVIYNSFYKKKYS